MPEFDLALAALSLECIDAHIAGKAAADGAIQPQDGSGHIAQHGGIFMLVGSFYKERTHLFKAAHALNKTPQRTVIFRRIGLV